MGRLPTPPNISWKINKGSDKRRFLARLALFRGSAARRAMAKRWAATSTEKVS
jgi:hypothetical protein